MRRIGTALFLTLAAPMPALVAQTTDAGIIGRVLGEQRAPLDDVEVEIRNAATGFRSSVTTKRLRPVRFFFSFPLAVRTG